MRVNFRIVPMASVIVGIGVSSIPISAFADCGDRFVQQREAYDRQVMVPMQQNIIRTKQCPVEKILSNMKTMENLYVQQERTCRDIHQNVTSDAQKREQIQEICGKLGAVAIDSPTKQSATKRKLPPNCIDATGLPGYEPGSMRCENDTSAKQSLREARSLMNLARKAARYHTYEEQTTAAQQYRNAAETFSKAGQSAEAEQATVLANKASADAERYQRIKNAEGAGRNRSAGLSGKASTGQGSDRNGDPNTLRNRLRKCLALKSRLGKLEKSDLAVDREAFKEQMEKNGC